MNRKNFMTVHGTTAVEWSRRYGIEPLMSDCHECGATLTTSIPFASLCGELRGLMAPECDCGNSNTPYCLVRDPRFGDLFDGPLSGAAKDRRGTPAKRTTSEVNRTMPHSKNPGVIRAVQLAQEQHNKTHSDQTTEPATMSKPSDDGSRK